MRILGIETATRVCAAAITEGGRVSAERIIIEKQVHSEKLIPLIRECLVQSKIGLPGLDGIAVSIGPGSFTGLRIGLSVVKGLAYAAGKPILGVPTLEALAFKSIIDKTASEGDILLPMIDARRDEVYFAAYTVKDGALLESTGGARAGSLLEVCAFLRRWGGARVLLLGDGAEKFRHFLEKEGCGKSIRYVFDEGGALCSAAPVAILGEAKLLRAETEDAASLEPLYVKDFYTLVKTQHIQVTS